MFAELVDTRRETNGRSVDTAAALENLASVTEEPSERVELLEEAYRIRLAVQGPAHPATRRSLGVLLGALMPHGPSQGGDWSGAEPVEILPAVMTLGTVRLDADDMDQRIADHDLAGAWQEHCVATSGPDAPVTMVAVCYLAHAHALLDQFDAQIHGAWALVNDAAQGLELDLGPAHPTSIAADQLLTWIADTHDETF
jgi:hypothetical protein